MTADVLAITRRNALCALMRPPPLALALSQWIKNDIVLPEGVSALPGAS